MKLKTEEKLSNAHAAFFDGVNFSPGQIAARENDYMLQNQEEDDDCEGDSFNFWATAKYLFFYLPGVSLLYFVTLFLSFVLVTQIEDLRHFTQAFFWLGLGAFMMMFGIGKLSDLKYLKVVAAVLIASFAASFSFFLVMGDMKGKFFGNSFYFLPIVIFLSYLTKKWVDREETEFL